MPQPFTNKTTNDTSSATAWAGGNGMFFVRGNFDGAKVSLQAVKYSSALDGDKDLVLFNPGQVPFFLGACDIQLKLENAGAATNINAGWEGPY